MIKFEVIDLVDVMPAESFDHFSVPQSLLLTNRIASEVMGCWNRDAINHFTTDPGMFFAMGVRLSLLKLKLFLDTKPRGLYSHRGSATVSL